MELSTLIQNLPEELERQIMSYLRDDIIKTKRYVLLNAFYETKLLDLYLKRLGNQRFKKIVASFKVFQPCCTYYPVQEDEKTTFRWMCLVKTKGYPNGGIDNVKKLIKRWKLGDKFITEIEYEDIIANLLRNLKYCYHLN
jgi:hypothetical protein